MMLKRKVASSALASKTRINPNGPAPAPSKPDLAGRVTLLLRHAFWAARPYLAAPAFYLAGAAALVSRKPDQ
jgi:hypothetical protein